MRRYRWLILLAVALVGISLVMHHLLPPLFIPDFADWPLDTTGYTIEELPVALAASFVRGHEVYLALPDGNIFRADDRDLTAPRVDLNSPLENGARMLFASSRGVIFASPNGQPTYRSADDGQTWSVCLDVPTWRMDEDDEGSLYVGNYTRDEDRGATLYKSTDSGVTWAEVFVSRDNHHVHTVRWDERAKRLYIAYGDGRTRGEAYSDDRGRSFVVLAQGHGHGHTDVAITADYVIWASDDQSGRVYRTRRQTGETETLMRGSQFIWWAVARDRQVYAGTMTSSKQGGERAVVLASGDQGGTWQKLLETGPSSGPYDQGFIAESRQLSADGWLYCAGGGKSYRMRRAGHLAATHAGSENGASTSVPAIRARP